MSRNAKYEEAQRAKGLKKVTLWIPQSREPEFKSLAFICCNHPNLTFNSLRDTVTGKYVSMERF